MYSPVNLDNKFSLFDAHWQPKVIAQMNDYQFKIVKISGDFIWHAHPETDEAFIVVGHVLVNPGEMYVVPKGVEHKTSAESTVKMMMIEPCGVLNTGHEGGERTAENDVWI